MSPPVNRPRRIEYLDLYRAIAIMAVVAIHATSTAVAHYPKNTWDHDLFYFWNTFLQFAVPAFLFLSSLVLFYNYSAKLNEKDWIISFYKKRMFYIFVPYVVWSLIYFVIKKLIAGKEPLAYSVQFVKQLTLGTAHTHLYFFLIILQFYIVFPWILYLTRKPWFRKYLPLYFIAAQGLFYVLNVKFDFERTGSLLPSYLIVIGFGAWMGLNFEWLMNKMMHLRYVLLVALISGAAISMYASGIIKTTLIEWPVLMYSVLFIVRNIFTLSACLVLLVLSEKVGTRGRRSEYKVSRFTDSLGKVAFGIFLIHPLVLMIWRLVLTDDFARHFSLGVVLSFIASLLLSWLCAVGLRRLKWGWVLIGR
ncbi:Peptidoglycan/LPS O-acetylase OafA/YrhL, contains acyltransferase and SGNH-hydrolase domains [Paenibacillus polysaccharolyticus]|uniref:Peptidoglycan/LPS O-acetylase OafA/YrhL, contains acyltransferase and SGNH-hydrolase domains n=1 Tax=Paenibacillus polysaccharolyticus TaxID=582692 RepID=A0A1G5E7I9_9BACL|nr:acyltransferase [Paenibacillus polysaccharolyticus]SCY22946.1 Peptidoglycan/LPS O-acetylase OafA/YrhL, contains acyltransferase and SGNH-hydrolase domains [Paenibacillus polysaccharolyticus]